MTPFSIVPSNRAIYDVELLKALLGTKLAQELQILCVIGAHRFDELPLIDRIAPRLRRIYVFEPLAEPLKALRALASRDSRITVFPHAIADRDGTSTFHVASNDGESSSLLNFGSHQELFPQVTMQSSIEVSTRTLDSVLAEHGLEPPDFMIIDVQGAEHLVLRACSSALLAKVRLIYTEVSTEAVYESAGTLADVEGLLAPRFLNVGFAPLRQGVPMHGNAVFVAQEDVGALAEIRLQERLRRGFHAAKRRIRGRP